MIEWFVVVLIDGFLVIHRWGSMFHGYWSLAFRDRIIFSRFEEGYDLPLFLFHRNYVQSKADGMRQWDIEIC